MSGIAWEEEREHAARGILESFGASPAVFSMAEHDPALWWLAGLTTIADWIGSDERVFPPEGGTEDSERLRSAGEAIQRIGFELPPLIPDLRFAELFGFPSETAPNDMQIRARDLIGGPGVYVIEAPMGMGKTEAALWVAYELLVARHFAM